MRQPVRNFVYWRAFATFVAGALCILGFLGHFLDWLKKHDAMDRNIALGFLAGYALLVAVSRDKLYFFIASFMVIIAWGVLGMFTHDSILGLSIILPCCLLVFLLLRWKGWRLM